MVRGVLVEQDQPDHRHGGAQGGYPLARGATCRETDPGHSESRDDDEERPLESPEVETGGLTQEKERPQNHQQGAEPDEDPTRIPILVLVVQVPAVHLASSCKAINHHLMFMQFLLQE